MSLASGAKLGPYEILAPIGAGGMGEVYRARDSRLGRDVAIKVLPASFSQDTDRLRRFEQEARAASLLNHPNIIAVYDIGSNDGAPYVVSELLEGETLRARLAGGKLSQRRAIEYALPVAHGLAAAHEKGIVHRDLKPENVFVTNDGRVKILDFGLAKLTQMQEGFSGSNLTTAAQGTEPGVVLGTLGYMSPEQIKGKAADARSDIFSFGAILYEMLSGERAFRADSAGETMAAILKEDPPELSAINQNVSPGLERIVRHCLEKSPEQRFHSAHDLAFDLEAVSSSSGKAAAMPPTRRRLSWPAFAGAIAVAAALAAGHFLWPRSVPRPPSFHRLTFRRGIVHAARFSGDGRTVVYSAAWQGGPSQVYSTRVDSTESRSLGLDHASLFALSRADEIAIARNTEEDESTYWSVMQGTLASVPLAGGSPRDLLQGVTFADYGRDGRAVAVARTREARKTLEFPPGKVLFETRGWISEPRCSPRDDSIAFIEHPRLTLPGGDVCIIDSRGKKRTLASGFVRAQGLAWSADGSEVWFTASREGSARALYGVDVSGKERLIYRIPGALTLHDVSRDGRVLLAREEIRRETMARGKGEPQERDVSWLDYSNVLNLTADGSALAFVEMGDGGGSGTSSYIRRLDGSPATLLSSNNTPFDLSQDGKWLLTISDLRSTHPRIVLYPTGPGEPKVLETVPMEYQAAMLSMDGRRVFLFASPPGQGLRTYVQAVEGGPPQPVTPKGFTAGVLDLAGSTDGNTIVVRDERGEALLWSVKEGRSREIPGFDSGNEAVSGFAADGTLYVGATRRIPRTIWRLDPATGKRQRLFDLIPADPAGVSEIDIVVVTPDARAYAYSYIRRFCDLYVVEGLK